MFQIICDVIILIGAVCVAIINIYNFFAKPTSKFKAKKAEAERRTIEEVLDERLPDVLYKHDLETREKYRNDRLNYLNEIKQSILVELEGTLKEIKEINLKQSEKLEKLNQSSKDMLRQCIMSIWFANLENQTLSITDREILDELYRDYKAQNGNSYIDKYYKRMKYWPVIDENGNQIEI